MAEGIWKRVPEDYRDWTHETLHFVSRYIEYANQSGDRDETMQEELYKLADMAVDFTLMEGKQKFDSGRDAPLLKLIRRGNTVKFSRLV